MQMTSHVKEQAMSLIEQAIRLVDKFGTEEQKQKFYAAIREKIFKSRQITEASPEKLSQPDGGSVSLRPD